jgi:negative regulator of sigma E activity
MEKISALVDGELELREAAGIIPDLKQHDDLREAWMTYHLIGDALRGQSCHDCGVAQSVAAKLAGEPTVLAPRASSSGGFGRRWALPSMAAAAAVAAVTWMGLQSAAPPGGNFQTIPITWDGLNAAAPMNGSGRITDIAATIGVTPVSQPASSIQLTAQDIQPYLAAHQPFSPSLHIQGLAPYLRTVSAGAAER